MLLLFLSRMPAGRGGGFCWSLAIECAWQCPSPLLCCLYPLWEQGTEESVCHTDGTWQGWEPAWHCEMSVGTNNSTSGAAVLKRCWVLHLQFPTEFLPASSAFSMENKIQSVTLKLGKDRPMKQISLGFRI